MADTDRIGEMTKRQMEFEAELLAADDLKEIEEA